MLRVHNTNRMGSNLDKVQAATHDSHYWYDTGDLIIVSQGVAFRVWQRLLAEYSVVFRSMFKFAQSTPPAARDLVDGCLVVLLDDSPEDWRQLLGLLYPRRADIKLGGQKIDMPFVSAIVRLGHKYELQGLYDQAMDRLTTYYTTSFDAWANGLNTAQWQPDPVHAITAINLARLTSTTSILPTALYICATLDREVLDEVLLGDGRTERLAEHDFHLVLEMKDCLTLENVQNGGLLLWHGPPCAQNRWGYRKCTAVWSKACTHERLLSDRDAPHPLVSVRALDSWVANVYSLPAEVAPPAPLGSGFLRIFGGSDWWWWWWWRRRSDGTLCRECRDHLEAHDREIRRKTWRKLPEFVGLTIEGWDEA